ncbi:MAG: adenylate/guanylate cyclase domain-containing protein [Rhodospirillales bacterium]
MVALALLALPIAVWFDLNNISARAMRSEANELNTVISSIRDYYAHDIVGRVRSIETQTKVVPNFREVPGAIPIPATLSLELGQAIGARQGNVGYRFFSDYPFKNRAPHPMDDVERQALASLRQNPQEPVYSFSGSLFQRQVRLLAPVLMQPECVACHNTHPESTKHDWVAGDVRGIQEIIIDQPIVANLFSFGHLLIYMAVAGAAGLGFVAFQHRQAARMRWMNGQLVSTNAFLGSISEKISKYLSPQIYEGIFSGNKDAVVSTERKKLTIFFSDIKDFTATTERLQPEELASLLNEYLTDMSEIALRHGATIDKFIGDAILAFFGDPHTRGVAEDAKAAVRMAIDMQRRLASLNAKWRDRGIEQPFRVRMGLNTGFCNVGNFGSSARIDYTIIGAEANLAARLQTIAEPGTIVISFETYALVRDLVRARPLPPISMKGIGRQVVPYVVQDFVHEAGTTARVVNEHAAGLDLFLDANALDERNLVRVRTVLQNAIAAVDARDGDAADRATPCTEAMDR